MVQGGGPPLEAVTRDALASGRIDFGPGEPARATGNAVRSRWLSALAFDRGRDVYRVRGATWPSGARTCSG